MLQVQDHLREASCFIEQGLGSALRPPNYGDTGQPYTGTHCRTVSRSSLVHGDPGSGMSTAQCYDDFQKAAKIYSVTKVFMAH